MQGKEIMILQSRIAALEQYNQHLLEQNKALKDLIKEYMRLLKDPNWPKSFFNCTNYNKEGE